ncbi:HelD family protein [Dactylosporangium sp. CS-033363]|uniref:HelD family protein n=1 Tax=Dactylosporangium sp. CS-033363 TaxID=3239935 RepID=UPI003D8FEF7C
MESKAAEIAAEQQHFDLAHKHRERARAELGDNPDAAANAGAGRWLGGFRRNRRDAMATAEHAVATGRMDIEHERFYIGHESIWDDQRQILVVNWKADFAKSFFEASVEDPHGLSRKRTFTCEANHILDFEDLVFAQLAAAVRALDGPDAALLGELDRGRTGEMHDIVATIQAAQYRLIRFPLEHCLVIEGGPGTGKTAVALHRVSWLLYNEQQSLRPRDVLVVGPHPAFTRYIRRVLPSLGDTEVEQIDIDQLGPPVQRGRQEDPATHRLKGEARMAGFLARALEARIGAPEAAERMLFDGRFLTLTGAEVADAVAAARQAGGPYAVRRQRLRARLAELVRDRGGPLEAERLPPVENLLERLWPLQSPPAFLRSLFGSRTRLAAAAGGEFSSDFSEQDVALLYRRGADRLSAQVWSAADIPLLDEVDELVNGTTGRYRHIVVDEAQDLSPMQLRAIGRRSSNGSFTLVGDLAQSTGAWARDSWDEVTAHLPAQQPRVIAPLRYGYRVPRQVYELAAMLLPLAAPGVEPTHVVREGPADPGTHVVEPGERAGRVAQIAREHLDANRFVGIICPAVLRAELEFALHANDLPWGRADQGELERSLNLVSPQEAKGLEFDAVIVVEPEEIVAEDPRGHRLLFVALTRTIRFLDIVASGDPLPLELPSAAAPFIPRQRRVIEPDPDPTVELSLLDRLAEDLAAMVAGGSPPPLWDEVLQRAATLLDQRAGRDRPKGRHSR